MLQAQQRQQQPTATPSSQAGCRGFYSDWALAALMGYAQVYTWVSKQGLTPNELRIWLETMIRTYVNIIKEDWDLFFEFSMAAAQMESNDRKVVSWT